MLGKIVKKLKGIFVKKRCFYCNNVITDEDKIHEIKTFGPQLETNHTILFCSASCKDKHIDTFLPMSARKY